MRVVVADTGPPHYLVLIGQADLLPRLFGKVILPAAVQAELSHPEAPAAVREWIAAPPAWLTVEPNPNEADAALQALDAGERAAILLATALSADLLLMDDRAGVMAARSRGFAVAGTLGVLDLAAQQGLLNLPLAVERLRATNFRCRPALIDALLAQHRPGGTT